MTLQYQQLTPSLTRDEAIALVAELSKIPGDCPVARKIVEALASNIQFRLANNQL